MLAKKVYDQSLLLAKFERELQEQQAYFCQQRSLGAKNNEDYECLKERMVASEK